MPSSGSNGPSSAGTFSIDNLHAILASTLAQPLPAADDGLLAPRQQPCYAWNGVEWQPAEPPAQSAAAYALSPGSTITLVTWNIDMLVPAAVPRMAAALEYLESLVSSRPSSEPIVILLQEMIESDLEQIRTTPWIQQRFCVTDVYPKHWLHSLYGTTTLVDSRLHIQNVFRVPWRSRFQRDGLFVDVSTGAGKGPLRLCNTHLESLVADPPVRPLQLSAAAPYMHDPALHASVLAGDLNAIQPFDRTLHADNALQDAYLDLGGEEDRDDGFTWGYQCPAWMKEKFGCSRMDKVLYCGKVRPVSLERIGAGVKIKENASEDVRQELILKAGGDWVSDHYGLMCRLQLTAAGGSRV